MRLDVVMMQVEKTINTTKFEPADGEFRPMDNFYVNSEALSLLPLNEGKMVLSISTAPFADGEVEITVPPVPFYRELGRVVRYQHTIERRGKERPAPNTPSLPVTLAYVNKSVLDYALIAEQKSLYFGISAVNESVIEDEEQAVDIAVDDEIARTDVVAAFEDFLREAVRVKRGERLTSRQIWAVWATRRGADPDDKTVDGVEFTDVARRFRVVFGAVTEPNPTRIDGRLQRYWSGFTIQPLSG